KRGVFPAPIEFFAKNPNKSESWGGLILQDIVSKYLEYSGTLVGSQRADIPLKTAAQNPPYVMCRWIMRVE
ncbi:MAG TPA: hypothetical protein VND64_04250, partial [Pirellulales bacterium]|nr:hypothetical protein [Pirellulales bacterium]